MGVFSGLILLNISDIFISILFYQTCTVVCKFRELICRVEKDWHDFDGCCLQRMMDDEKTIHEEGEEVETPASPQEKAEIEKLEEQKLKSKFPGK